MNHFHRVIFNPSLGVRQVVSEIARSGRGAGRQASAGSPSGTPRLSALAVASLLAWCAMPQAQAATCDAHSSAELVTCIGNANSGDTINLKNNITLNANLGAIHLAGPASGLTINGEGHTLDGNRMYRGFFVGAGNVSVNDLTLQNMLAKGGNGGEGYAPGGGGMGAGGAVFVAAGASANLHNVTIAANAATGGNGGNATEAVNTGLGGGGGMGGNGGGVLPGSSASGRGGGGLFEDGQIGSTLGNGGNGGGPTGGAGDTGSRTGGNGGNYSGGGGGSTLPNAVGGSGGLGGGGGGANSIGGDGGFGGGGGGGMYGRGGTGGFGGGGGSAGYGDGPAGGGGFGGSNGVSGVDSNANSGGGGGAGMGGGIFVMAGGSLTLSGNTNLRDNTVSGGTGGGSARSGAAFGAGIFLQGGTAQLAFAPDTGTQTVADAIADQTGSAGFGGSVGITKAGAGTTVLSGDNKYTGGTTITAGTLQIGGGGTTGAITGDVANNGTLAFSRSDTLNFSGVISGNGNVRQNGSGTLQLSRPNTYLGGTDLHAGVVSVSADNNLGDVSGALRFNGGVLQNTAGFTTDRTILFSPSPSGGIFQNDADLTITSAFHAPSLTKRGAAALVLAGDNVVSGGTTITAGTLQLGDGGTSGSITGSVVNDGTLAFNRTDDISFSGVISGMGNVRQSGTGTVTLSVANTYRGGTTINAGVLSIDADNKLGHTAGAVTFSGGTFQNTAAFTTGRAFHADASNSTFQTDADLILTSPVTGNGNLVKTGAATLVLEGNSTYAGNTTISGGTLQIGNGGASGKTSLGTITTDATLAFNRADDFTESNPIHGTGQVVQKGTGTLVLAGDNTYRGNTSMNAGVISVFSDGNLGGRSGALIFNGGALQTTAAFTTARAITLNVDGTLQTDADLNAAGVISGAGNLTKNGAGHLILSGEN
ncbi:MAG: autotransporter-associated beta strand repeat-containing protein, partial [Polaromonas sp.]|nr:autotransporter-associated beta strand repeat-containing protein [Polaromonas sp.]